MALDSCSIMSITPRSIADLGVQGRRKLDECRRLRLRSWEWSSFRTADGGMGTVARGPRTRRKLERAGQGVSSGRNVMKITLLRRRLASTCPNCEVPAMRSLRGRAGGRYLIPGIGRLRLTPAEALPQRSHGNFNGRSQKVVHHIV
jgi:hypothetical protein